MTKMKMQEMFKKMKPGVMYSTAISNATNESTSEIVFVIKDYNHKVKKMVNNPYANVRASIEDNGTASGLLYLVQFGYSEQNIYHAWFDKTIQLKQLIHLLNQKKVIHYFVNEKNKVVDILAIPNSLNEIAHKYLQNVDPIWTVKDFDTLVYETMGKHKSRQGLWKYITKNMAS
ncbi:hypothetical protein HLK66_25040 [Niallia circulans]|uniref:hypothetical protein n=1 Tax=Niallia circulans TaxID=1397 RepID=UPI00149034B7|nr:hypothetical protein [Niallia circulans]QJX64594.1 hypothetical protein HLK66_25040 [Niallia circulans]